MGFFLFYILGPALVGGLMLFAGQRLRLRDQTYWSLPAVAAWADRFHGNLSR